MIIMKNFEYGRTDQMRSIFVVLVLKKKVAMSRRDQVRHFNFAVWVKSFPRRALGATRPERAEESCWLTL